MCLKEQVGLGSHHGTDCTVATRGMGSEGQDPSWASRVLTPSPALRLATDRALAPNVP